MFAVWRGSWDMTSAQAYHLRRQGAWSLIRYLKLVQALAAFSVTWHHRSTRTRRRIKSAGGVLFRAARSSQAVPLGYPRNTLG